jgi:hypothetical protein
VLCPEDALSVLHVGRGYQKVVVSVVGKPGGQKRSGLGDHDGRLNGDDIIVEDLITETRWDLPQGVVS